jgi:hypothetical protein
MLLMKRRLRGEGETMMFAGTRNVDGCSLTAVKLTVLIELELLACVSACGYRMYECSLSQ